MGTDSGLVGKEIIHGNMVMECLAPSCVKTVAASYRENLYHSIAGANNAEWRTSKDNPWQTLGLLWSAGALTVGVVTQL